jgi:23S rRNA pseudouridine1911/1915/1917 synthase
LEVPLVQLLVAQVDSGERLDAFLADHIEGWSRARLQRLIADEAVFVNGVISKSSHKLQTNDKIEVELTPPPATEFTPENIPIEIVHEDDDIVVVNKPAGMVVHPAAGVSSGTLANALAFHFQQLSTRGGHVRPGIVHRLDKGTSGLLVVAKTEAAHEHLGDQFRAREVFKSYVALAHGQFEKRNGEIDKPLGRDARNRTRMAVVRGGREALTLFRVREQYDRFALLDVELKTGRTHQIRVHLASQKNPVVGDDVYGAGRDKTVAEPVIRSAIGKLQRQFLHAARLGFRHPRTQEQVVFSAILPADLQSLLNLVRTAAGLPAREY